MEKESGERRHDAANRVMAPGGPRPGEQVHAVEAGGAVRREADGTYAVLPKEEGPRAPNAIMTDFVNAPGGRRPASQVHLLEPGHVLRREDGGFTQLGPSDETIRRIEVAETGEAAVPATGWITDAAWQNTTGAPIVEMRTTFDVPPEPATHSGQLIYLFPGLVGQGGSSILQPVLQWGFSAAGGGLFWSVASWYVVGQTAVFHTPAQQVAVGDTLNGVMEQTGSGASGFDYNCFFAGFGSSEVTVQNIPELQSCYETLEAYELTQCSDYPATPSVAMTEITITVQGSADPPLQWTAENRVTDCGQGTVVVSNSPAGGEVDLYFSGQ